MFGIGDEMFGKWETKCLALGEQKFGGNLPQPTRKHRSRKKYLQDILENQLNLEKFYFFHLWVPFKSLKHLIFEITRQIIGSTISEATKTFFQVKNIFMNFSKKSIFDGNA